MSSVFTILLHIHRMFASQYMHFQWTLSLFYYDLLLFNSFSFCREDHHGALALLTGEFPIWEEHTCFSTINTHPFSTTLYQNSLQNIIANQLNVYTKISMPIIKKLSTGYHVYTITSHIWRLGSLTEVTLDLRRSGESKFEWLNSLSSLPRHNS